MQRLTDVMARQTREARGDVCAGHPSQALVSEPSQREACVGHAEALAVGEGCRSELWIDHWGEGSEDRAFQNAVSDGRDIELAFVAVAFGYGDMGEASGSKVPDRSWLLSSSRRASASMVKRCTPGAIVPSRASFSMTSSHARASAVREVARS